jgi:hypothetical protein
MDDLTPAVVAAAITAQDCDEDGLSIKAIFIIFVIALAVAVPLLLYVLAK